MRSIQRGVTTTFIILIILGTAVALTFVYFASYEFQKQKASQINTFEDCAKLYPVMESYPEQCNTPDGKHFTRELPEEEKQRLVPPKEILQSIDETANWKTYTNETIGFEFKYPSEASISGEFEDQFGNSVSIKSKNLDLSVYVYHTKLYDPGDLNTDKAWDINANGVSWKAKYYKENKCSAPCPASTTVGSEIKRKDVGFTFTGEMPTQRQLNNYLSSFKLK